MRIYLTLLLLAAACWLPAQTYTRFQAPAVVDGDLYPQAFTGGLNNPQPGVADFNNDGLNDLFVFDRFGNIPLTFLGDGQGGYSFAPEYAANFPNLINWAVLRDYNQDGAMDIFTHFATPVQGITVYRGSYNGSNQLVFEPFDFCCELFDIIYFEQTNGSVTQVYVSPVDYPEVVDVDGDGDLDILTFSIGGGYVEYFENRSVEMGYGLDSLIYQKEDICWGKFYEASFSESITLSSSPNTCATLLGDETPVDARHPGSTLCTFDGDGDGDREIVLGDVNFGKVNYLVNGGDEDEAFMVDQDPNFPGYDVPVEIPNFPAAFFLDFDQDGKRDFLAAPNQLGGTPNYEVLWFYQNTGTDASPVFELAQKNALTNRMLDFGAGSHPALVDYNADGLLDLVVGTDGYFDPGITSNRDSRLVLLLNTGTAAAPAFELADDDLLGMSQYSGETWNFAPIFADMDADGDKDLLFGEQDGRIFYAENTAGPGAPLALSPVTFNWKGIDVGLNSRPAAVDLNRDGLLDLVIGERNGNFNYFPNLGTAQSPAFEPEEANAPNIEVLGNVSTELPSDLSAGNSAPVFLDSGTEFYLIAGSQAGPVQLYGDIDGNLNGTFTLLNANLGNTREGKRTDPAFGDLDGDGLLEMVVGNSRGGMSLFDTDLDASQLNFTTIENDQPGWRLEPNPATGEVWIRFETEFPGAGQWRLLDMNGREVLAGAVNAAGGRIGLQGVVPGIYWVHLFSNRVSTVKKLAVF